MPALGLDQAWNNEAANRPWNTLTTVTQNELLTIIGECEMLNLSLPAFPILLAAVLHDAGTPPIPEVPPQLVQTTRTRQQAQTQHDATYPPGSTSAQPRPKVTIAARTTPQLCPLWSNARSCQGGKQHQGTWVPCTQGEHDMPTGHVFPFGPGKEQCELFGNISANCPYKFGANSRCQDKRCLFVHGVNPEGWMCPRLSSAQIQDATDNVPPLAQPPGCHIQRCQHAHSF